MGDVLDVGSYEEAFVAVAKSYSDRHGISYASWREVGVPAGVLTRAGLANRLNNTSPHAPSGHIQLPKSPHDVHICSTTGRHGGSPERRRCTMNRKILAGIAAGLLTTATLLIVGVGAYRAGERSDRTVEVVGEVATTGEGTTRTVLVPAAAGWHGGWHGPGPGFLIFPLIVIGLFLLFASRRGGWRGAARATVRRRPPRVAPPPARRRAGRARRREIGPASGRGARAPRPLTAS